VGLGDGQALAVDAPRDLRDLWAAAGRRRLTVAFAADTHLHADFLSGARQLAAGDGAHILASTAGCRAFGHRTWRTGTRWTRAGMTLRAWATSGHTAEHRAYLLLDGLAGTDYSAAMGIRPATVVPAPGAERTFSEPPSADRRSAMFWMPEPMAVVEES
jgi:hydroxyacylglutathione hydrolase